MNYLTFQERKKRIEINGKIIELEIVSYVLIIKNGIILLAIFAARC